MRLRRRHDGTKLPRFCQRLRYTTENNMPSIAKGFLLAAFALLFSMRSNAQTAPLSECAYDREKMLALDESGFDQDMTGGWRAVAKDENCRIVAADLIRDYRQLRGPRSWKLMAWHEGQLRAMAGDSNSAIPLLEESRIHDGSAPGWNEYLDATVAFLKADRAAFDKAYAALLALPKPDYWEKNYGTKGRSWPLNRNVVEGLGRCFGKGYAEAYGPCGNRPAL